MKHYRKHLLVLIIALVMATSASGGEILHNGTSQSPKPGTHIQSNYHTISETVRYVTAYNVGDPKQNYGNPCISASGENICKALARGAKRCAANFVPFGTELFIQAYGICVVTDRTNSRYRNRVDIAMRTHELRKAKEFGKKKLYVKILKRESSDKRRPKLFETATRGRRYGR